MVKVKICANRNIEDAQICLDAGADIIGILVGQNYVSDDFIDKETAKEINDFVDGRCDVSLVTHLTDSNEIIELTKYIGNNIIQLHSDIEESEVKKIKEALPNVKLVRLISITSDGAIYTDYKKFKYADYYILDSINLEKHQIGGTGLTHNWSKSALLIKKLNKPTFLAGGLNPNNIGQAIKIVNPYGVDVNSGCKNETGRKDKDKVRDFVYNAKHANNGTIVLTSCGFRNEEFKNRFYNIVNKEDLKNKKVLYITTAIDGEPLDNREWVEEEYKTILDLGISECNIIEYKIGNDINVNDFDIIYMMGGNTIYLLDMVRKYNFDKEIISFLNNDKIYIGSSAGSQILGTTIKLCSIYENNFVNMTDFTAMGIVDKEVVPHANKKEELIKKSNRDDLILLYDGDGIIIR